MPSYTVPITGPNGPGSMTVNANNPAEAAVNATQGGNTPTGPGVLVSGQTTTPGSPSSPSTPGNPTGGGIDAILQALQRGDQRAFDEAVRQFNQTFGVTQAGVTGTYNGAPTLPALTSYANQFGTWGVPQSGAQTLAAQQQAVSQAQAEAGLTGYYTNPSALQYRPGTFVGNTANGGLGFVLPNGQISPIGSLEHFRALGGDPSTIASLPKLSPEQWQALVNAPPGGAGTPTMAREQQTYAQQLGAITTAAGLQANPFRQAQVIGQLGGVLRGTGVAGFQAPGQAQGQTDFSGMGNMQRLIDDIRGGPNAINSQSTQSVLDAIPTPNKLDSVNFARSSPLTQNMVLQGMQEKYGLNPNDALAQIKNTLPQFQAPTTFGGTVKR